MIDDFTRMYQASRQIMQDHSRAVTLNKDTWIQSADTKAKNSVMKPPTLSFLCLRSIESSLGKGLAMVCLQELPLGLVEQIREFVFTRGSRMAQMEVSRAMAPLLSAHVASLDFGNCGPACLGDSALLELAAGCSSSLMSLDLRCCRLLTNAAIAGVLLRCTALEKLTLSGCGRITDEALCCMPRDALGLTRLELAGLENITVKGIVAISFLPLLEEVCLNRCPQIEDDAVTALQTGACGPSLRWLDLSVTGVTDACVASLRKMTSIDYIKLSATAVSTGAVASFARGLSLPAALPDAPKTRARNSRTLLMGSTWSIRQAGAVPQKTFTSGSNDLSSKYGHGTRRGWSGSGPSKALRQMAGVKRHVSCSNKVKVGFGHGEETAEDIRFLMKELVNGIVALWPAVPSRTP